MGSATNTIFPIWKKGLGDFFTTTRSRQIAATKVSGPCFRERRSMSPQAKHENRVWPKGADRLFT